MTQPAPLSSAALIAAASQRSGLTDFGKIDFREALDAYVDGLNQQLPLFAERGSMIVQEEVVSALQHRLRIEDFISRNPQVREERISRPVFVTGLYRSGTTRMQNLLSADPRLIHLQAWQTIAPVPVGETLSDGQDPRVATSQQALDMLKQAAPHAAQAHPLDATDPSEEFPLMIPSFRAHDAKQVGSDFANWLEVQDNTPMYRDLHRALQVLQFQFKRPRVSEQRFTLKAPIHLGNVTPLLKVFPDAKIIVTHRDPFPAVHSFAMVRESLRGLYCDTIDLEMVGGAILEQAAGALTKLVALRKTSSEGTFFDLGFGEVIGGLGDRLDDIYHFIDAPLTNEVRDILHRVDEQRDEHKSRAARADAAIYGLSRDKVHDRTADYLGWARDQIGELV